MTDTPQPEPEATSTELAAPKRGIPALISSDEEIRRCFRIADGLYASGMFKELKKPEEAFAKILIGRDLGISPTQALLTIDLVKGNIFMRGVLLAAFVRKSKEYDYRVVSIVGDADDTDEAKQHATVRFFAIHPDGEREPLVPDITYTIAMARKADIVKAGSAWMTARRNMLFWRAMSDGVKFHCPDLLGGVPVYTEADPIPEPRQLGAGTGNGQPEGIELPEAVEAVIARATELGHAGYSDRGAVEMAVGDQPVEFVERWCSLANTALEEMAAAVESDVVEEDEADV